MSDDREPVDRAMPAQSGNLAPVALGLGIAGLLLSIVPFYGFFFALPLSVVAVVLGLTARSRPGENRGQAVGGLATGGIGLLLLVGWAGWFAWGRLGFGSFVSQTSVEVDTGEAMAPATVHAERSSPDDASPNTEGPAVVSPGESRDELVTGMSGEAQLTVDQQSATMSLDDCALAEHTGPGVLVRGDGPDGRLVIAQQSGFGELVLDIEGDRGPSGTYTGSVTGMSGQGGSGGLLRDRRRFQIDGRLRDLYSGEAVDVSLIVTCG